MRVLVCGGRHFNETETVRSTLDGLNRQPTVIIEGGGAGADHQAAMWARVRRVDRKCYPADWQKNGRAAGPIRNQIMLDDAKPDLVIAFPGGRGTADMVRRAHAAGVEVRQVG